MLVQGFDNEKYLKLQSKRIKERISLFGEKLYLEFDEGGFAGANRAANTHIDIAPGAGGDVFVNVFHSQPPSAGVAPPEFFLYRVCPDGRE